MRTDLLVIFTRPFWIDEWHTLMVANRPSLSQVFSDLRAGSDFAPPFIHVLTWLLRHVIGVSPVALRSVALVLILTALVFLFLTLRRRFDFTASIAGTLATGSHSLIIQHSFEIRFYAPWFLCATVLAWAFGLDAQRAESRRRDVIIAIAAMLLVTTHWFGVITLGLMSLGALATYGSRWREGFRRVLPAGAGLVMLALCLPLLFGQRGSIVTKSWMPEVDRERVIEMMQMFWAAYVLQFAVLIILIGWLREGVKEKLKPALVATIRDPSVGALLAPIVMPIILTIVSLKQPAMLPRYMITALLAWAPLVGLAVYSLGRVMRLVFIAFLLFLVGLRVVRLATEHRDFNMGIWTSQWALRDACKRNLPVIFLMRHHMYPTMNARTEACPLARYLELSNATLANMYPREYYQTANFFKIENEFSELHLRLYAFPRVIAQQTLDTMPAFILMGWDGIMPPYYKKVEVFIGRAFPKFTVKRLAGDVALITRITNGAVKVPAPVKKAAP